jgi:hypothetical protein
MSFSFEKVFFELWAPVYPLLTHCVFFLHGDILQPSHYGSVSGVQNMYRGVEAIL